MSDLLAARSQMAISLAFHIVFAAIGIGLPVLMLLSEGLWLRTGRRVYLEVTHAWAKGLAIFFAVGAVSGTVLSFELGLLWPRFMQVAGPLIGMPFSLEGFAFFTEGIFLGIYLYGWDRISPRAHFAAAAVIAVSGTASALFVLSVNGWMNAPRGYVPGEAGSAPVIDPVAALDNPFWISNTIHMVLAAYMATALGTAAVHAWRLMRDPHSEGHRVALRLSVAVGAVVAIVQPFSGDVAGRRVAEYQPAKLAAMEAHFHTGPCAPLRIGGLPDLEMETVRYSLDIPCGLSILAEHNPNAIIVGLDGIPSDERPPVPIVHAAFQIMLGIGTALALLGVWILLRLARRRRLTTPWLLRSIVVAGPLAFVAIQAGWIVTEVGRQPWIIQGVMRTEDAVTPMPALVAPFTAFTLLYVGLAVVVVILMRRITADWTGLGTEPS